VVLDLKAVFGRFGKLPLRVLEAGEPLMEPLMEPRLLEKLGRLELLLEKLALGDERGDGYGEPLGLERPREDGEQLSGPALQDCLC
jgi:hypothetical protein